MNVGRESSDGAGRGRSRPRALSAPRENVPAAVRERVEDGYDLRTTRELMGHSDVGTTRVYTHALNKGGRGVRSPPEKGSIYPMLSFKRFINAAVTINGIELALKIRKEQFDTSAVIARTRGVVRPVHARSPNPVRRHPASRSPGHAWTPVHPRLPAARLLARRDVVADPAVRLDVGIVRGRCC